ncbi:MAG: 4a-hydroxytetrahydrobiopterin dehydratase [Balneolaceae bacterium]|nr:4a-hydroxytetrahydrobiopterin dehydratase [Balneolaceae bacterium]
MEPLKEEKIIKLLSELDGWKFEDDMIKKDFEFNDFKEALAFIVRVGFEAESLGHHPNLTNVYNQVGIALQTHDIGNKVSAKDIELATKIEALLS